MIAIQEFLIRARLDRRSLETWIAVGWLIPPQADGEPTFSDVDLARAQLIRDLRDDLGVNDEGISVILHLLDQMHGVRRSMRELLQATRASEPGSGRTRTPSRSRRRR
jgi:chaperone modulatory protein CbpM